MKILFILKRRPDFNPVQHSVKGLSTGLFNSASFMDQMLNDAGIESAMEVAIDNNCIDRMVRQHRPTHVILEALWVIPTKFAILTKLHPNVKWIVRLHSEMPFISGEGMAMNWIGDYLTYSQISIGVNAPRMMSETKEFLKAVYNWSDEQVNERVVYMPNFYPKEYKTKYFADKPWVDISCFGAIRPLKNHMVQAIAALKFARMVGKKLKFHINSGRIEMKGDPHINNLCNTFEHLAGTGHELISHEWTPREGFLKICAEMDIGMQCNFSETFNIVGADLICQGVPLVGSKEIPWINPIANADPTASDDIARALFSAWTAPQINVKLNQESLDKYTTETRKIWLDYFRG